MSEENKEAIEVQPVSVIRELAQGEIDIQISTAKRYPRSIKAFQDEVKTMATLNEDVAASCFYSVPRAGKMIQGPSARFAEIVALAWGNLRAGARVIVIEETQIIAQGKAFDLEKNTAYEVEVRRKITDKKGRRYSEDMITTTCNAACSIALRNAVLKVVPKSYTDPIFHEVKKIAIGDASTLVERRSKMLGKYALMGVLEEHILAKVEKKNIVDVNVEDLEALLGIFNAIKDGDTSIDEEFFKMAAQDQVKPIEELVKEFEAMATSEKWDFFITDQDRALLADGNAKQGDLLRIKKYATKAMSEADNENS